MIKNKKIIERGFKRGLADQKRISIPINWNRLKLLAPDDSRRPTFKLPVINDPFSFLFF
jgi:hypothetical protein